jgi:TRAP-type C4-dicarboxylate transport system permease small subunit
MTPLRFRRPLQIIAAGVAVLSLLAVGAVMAMASGKLVAPTWITSTALYGLPVAFLLMLVLVVDAIAARRRTPKPGER